MAGCSPNDAYRPLRVGDALPSYSARSLDGRNVELSDLDGHPLLVNVWATWCIPCRAEMPALEELYRRYETDGLQVVGVNIDAGRDDAPVEAFLADLAITFENLRDPEDRITRTFRLVGVPETLLIDREGKIAHRWIGRFDPLADETTRLVTGLLTTR